MNDVRAQKAALRRELAAQLRAMPTDARRVAARAAMEILVGRPEWQAAKVVMLFAPLPEELDIWPLAETVLREGRRLWLPRFDPVARVYRPAEVQELTRDVAVGAFGIREPLPGCTECSANQLDFVLVPGLGFDHAGRRLGRGKGYYDRLLTTRCGTACGLAWDWQVLPLLPSEAHDRSVDCLLTPTRWLAVARRNDER